MFTLQKTNISYPTFGKKVKIIESSTRKLPTKTQEGFLVNTGPEN